MNECNNIYINNLTAHVKSALEEIALFCKKHNYQHPQVIGASKKRSTTEILTAKAVGLSFFGENYVQEAASKHNENAYIDTQVALIGRLQSNKAKQAVSLFDSFHGLDSIKLASALEKACANLEKTWEVFIQVNLAEEQQKGGVEPKELPALIQHISSRCPHLHLTGLMTLPPTNIEPTPYFQQLANLAREHNLPHLSIGMSGDWQTAIKCGATHIRLGTSLFGPRTT